MKMYSCRFKSTRSHNGPCQCDNPRTLDYAHKQPKPVIEPSANEFAAAFHGDEFTNLPKEN